MIQSSIVSHDITWLTRQYEAGRLNTNISIQRREVWDIPFKSNLIVSYTCGVPVEDLFFEETGIGEDGEMYYNVIDGKNRAITTSQFLNDGFAISPNILKTKLFQEIYGISIKEIIGKKFSELPERIQNVILERQIPFTIARPMTENERALVYFMRNQAVSLADMELMIPIVGENIMNSLISLSEHNFMQNKVKITAPARRKKADIRIIIEYYMLSRKTNIGLTKLEFKTFCDDINDSIEIIDYDEVKKILDYLDGVFEKKMPYLNRAGLPMIFMLAKKSMEEGVLQKEFFDMINTFFEGIQNDEAFKKSMKSYKISDVQFRIKSIMGIKNKQKKSK